MSFHTNKNEEPYCSCLHEIENGLPRTQFCFMPCHDQHRVLTRRELKDSGITNIPINIWDDYYDDGFVPEGEIQESTIYVESKLSSNVQYECLNILLNCINTKFNKKDVTFKITFYDSAKKYPQFVGTEHESMLYKRWEIKVENLTHKLRHELLELLQNSNLTYENIPFNIYSES